MENRSVCHVTYGRGQITEQNEKILRVRFEGGDVGEKSFVYPDAFERYLRYEDSALQQDMDAYLERMRRAKADASAEREARRIHALTEAKKQRKAIAAARRKAVRKKAE